jgi:two-component system CheB/CheR fusion protein
MKEEFAFLNSKQLNKLFPFYLVVDNTMQIRDKGAALSKLLGNEKRTHLLDVFQFLRPNISISTFSELLNYSDQLIVLRIIDSGVRLRGQLIHDEDHQTVLFAGSVWMNSIDELEATKLTLNDFALHDPLFELLQIIKGQEIVTDDIKGLVNRMSEQKEIIEKREQKYHDLLDNLYDAVISFDENSNIIECNKALCTMTGYSEEELLQMNGQDITYEDDWEIARQSTQELLAKGFISNFQLRAVTKSGRIINIEISSNAVIENGVYKGSRDIVRDITERKRIEDQIRDLSLVTEQTSSLVIIASADRKIEWVNNSFTNVTGYTKNEVVGLKPGKLLQGKGTDPEVVARMRAAMNEGKSFRGTVLNYSKAGKPYWNELSINPIRDSSGKIIKYISVATDVTELIRKNEELLNAELRWKFALEGSGDGVFEFNIPEGKFYGTDSLKRLLGLDLEIPDLEFSILIDILHPDDRESATSAFFEFIGSNENIFRHELRLRNNTGDYIWVLVRATVSKRSSSGIPLKVLGTTADITHIKETERELMAAKQEAERASEYKNQFLATMSHEIRTPLNAIIGLTNIMLMAKPKGELKENLDTLSFSGNHLLSLINDILDLSKIEAGKIDFVQSEFYFPELIKDLHQTFLPKCEEKKIKLTFCMEESIPSYLIGDSMRLVQILNNLVNNAVKFTDHGAISINVRNITSGGNLRLYFEVKDSGIGINKQRQKDIFNDFVQADSSIVQKYGGTGLGLTITKKLVELQGGIIGLESSVGCGSTFFFEMPFKVGTSTEERVPTAVKFQEQEHSLNGMKVLLVEDIPVNQKVAVSYLTNWNAEVICASNGKEALEIFNEGKFDVLLVDLYMPVMNGFDTIENIRMLEKGRSVPIIALTASAETSTLQRAINCGANLCLSKPINAKQLFDTLTQLDSNFEKKSKTPEAKIIQFDQYNKTISPVDINNFKYIDLKNLKDASLGNEKFVLEMIGILKQEIPMIIHQANTSLMETDFDQFASAIHKLKNSLLMLGMKNVKNQLNWLESNARAKEKLDKMDGTYSLVLKKWENASAELEMIKP